MSEPNSPDDELARLVVSGRLTDEDDEDVVVMSAPALVFRVGSWWFSLPPEAVFEVGALERVNPVPALPGHVLGLILLRNQLVPVVDLAKLIKDIPAGEPAQTAARVVVVGDQSDAVGIRADEAHGILEIEVTPMRGTTEHGFVIGAATWNGHHVQRLDGSLLLAAGLET